MNKVRTQVIAEHEFENFYVKLFENDLALCDGNGNEEMAIRYLDIEENVELIDKKYTVNNIIFGTLAGICFHFHRTKQAHSQTVLHKNFQTHVLQ